MSGDSAPTPTEPATTSDRDAAARSQNGPPLCRLNWLFVAVSTLTLAICVFYTVAYAYVGPPYSGLTLTGGWIVTDVDPCDAHPGWCEANRDGLHSVQVGDHVVTIGDQTHEEYQRDWRLVPFDGYSPGDTVPLTVSRGGREQAIRWQMPAVTLANRAMRLAGLLFWSPFWLVGTGVLFLLQPREGCRRLLVLLCYVTAIFLSSGIIAASHVAASALVLQAVTWVMVPLYLHVHLVLPGPLPRQVPRSALRPVYALAAILFALDFFQALPDRGYNLAQMVTILGSVAALAWRLSNKTPPRVRQAARLMLMGVSLALGPGLVLWLVPTLVGTPDPTR